MSFIKPTRNISSLSRTPCAKNTRPSSTRASSCKSTMRIDALNHGLRDLPIDRIRFHMCWGSYHGPHKYDIPLKDIADLILKVRAGAYSIEASNPCHEHEWRVWQATKLPDGKI